MTLFIFQASIGQTCHSYTFYSPKTQNEIGETQLPFEFKVINTCFSPRKLKMEWMKLHFLRTQSVEME